MRRTKTQCKQRTIPLKLVHGSRNYDFGEFTVGQTEVKFQRATKEFKKAIDPTISVFLHFLYKYN